VHPARGNTEERDMQLTSWPGLRRDAGERGQKTERHGINGTGGNPSRSMELYASQSACTVGKLTLSAPVQLIEVTSPTTPLSHSYSIDRTHRYYCTNSVLRSRHLTGGRLASGTLSISSADTASKNNFITNKGTVLKCETKIQHCWTEYRHIL